MSSGMIGAIAVGGGTGVIDSAGIGGMAGTVLIRGSPFSLPDNCRASRQLLYHERSLCREEPTFRTCSKVPAIPGTIKNQAATPNCRYGEELRLRSSGQWTTRVPMDSSIRTQDDDRLTLPPSYPG